MAKKKIKKNKKIRKSNLQNVDTHKLQQIHRRKNGR